MTHGHTSPEPLQIRGDLIENLGLFCTLLREHGVMVTLAEEADAAAALLHIDLSDREEFYWTLRSILVVHHKDLPVFDSLFWKFWKRRTPEPGTNRPPEERPEREARPRPEMTQRIPREGEAEDGPGHPATTEEELLLGYSPEALLRKKSFDALSPPELTEMERLLARMVLKLPTRRSRRMAPSPRRDLVDLRRSFRATLSYGGEFVELAHRERVIERPRIVLLCDVSGSMDPYSRFLLRFLLSFQQAAERVETFVFNTSLTHLTPLLAKGEITAILKKIAQTVPDWSGGTNIGGCLTVFLAEHGPAILGRDAVVVILSDGLDRGDTDLLTHAMQGIRKKARKVIWLNPLLGHPDYEPLCLGMKAALPFVDHFGEAHNLESLENLIDHLRI